MSDESSATSKIELNWVPKLRCQETQLFKKGAQLGILAQTPGDPTAKKGAQSSTYLGSETKSPITVKKGAQLCT
jgi:hypothetical protein